MAESEPEVVLQSWTGRVNVLSNPAAWKGVTMALGGGALFMGLFASWIARSLMGLAVGAGIFAGLMVVFVLVAAVIDLAGGLRVQFLLTSAGVRSYTGSGARSVADAAFVGAVLAGSLAGLAASHQARREQRVFIPWASVSSVTINQPRQYIEVRGALLDKPIGLYCTPDTFEPVLAELKARCPGAAMS